MRTSGLLIRRARVRVSPSPPNNSNEIAEGISSDTVSADTSQSASSGAACPNVSHSHVTVAPDDGKPPFAGGRRLERVRCDACDGAGFVSDEEVAWDYCPRCYGRKFAWVAVVDAEGP